jgi:hypothetical protein
MDSSNNSYQVGNNIFNSKDDVKAELLKGVVSFVITSIQSGIPVDSTNTVIMPGMDDKIYVEFFIRIFVVVISKNVIIY